MTRGQASRLDWGARHREEIRAAQKARYVQHAEECCERCRARYAYISQRLQEIELNDDPESLLYAGEVEE